ncbi:MAG: hypothetical protein IPK63_23320 [Candidatus Competibacteraceae bacterium]|nr:hypothetical protein [Candidatus Competibacteraceae bacterium]
MSAHPMPFFAQPAVGVPCELPSERLEAAITLLRVIEQLPLLSDPEGLTPERALQVLATVHANHLHLAAYIRDVLVAHPEQVGSIPEPEPAPTISPDGGAAASQIRADHRRSTGLAPFFKPFCGFGRMPVQRRR